MILIQTDRLEFKTWTLNPAPIYTNWDHSYKQAIFFRKGIYKSFKIFCDFSLLQRFQPDLSHFNTIIMKIMTKYSFWNFQTIHRPRLPSKQTYYICHFEDKQKVLELKRLIKNKILSFVLSLSEFFYSVINFSNFPSERN